MKVLNETIVIKDINISKISTLNHFKPISA